MRLIASAISWIYLIVVHANDINDTTTLSNAPSLSGCWLPPNDSRLDAGFPIGIYGAISAGASAALRRDYHPLSDTDSWFSSNTKGLLLVLSVPNINAVAKAINCNPLMVSFEEEIQQQRQSHVYYVQDEATTHTINCAVKPLVNFGSSIEVAQRGELQVVCDIAVSSAFPPVQSLSSARLSLPETAFDSNAANACIKDEMRYGQWVPYDDGAEGKRENLSCRSYRWENETCGPSADRQTFCEALGCRDLLMVGDSLMYRNFLSIARNQAFSTIFRDLTFWNYNKFKCPPYGKPWATLRLNCNCAKGATSITFHRHDFLIGGPRPARKIGWTCGGWIEDASFWPPSLPLPILILSTGAHIIEFPTRSRGNLSFHEARAIEIAGKLRESRYAKAPVVFLKMQWGVKNFSREPARPLEKAPTKIIEVDGFMWRTIPKITATFARVFAQRLGARVVDVASALALRPDCRCDYLHSLASVVEQSFIPMLQHAIRGGHYEAAKLMKGGNGGGGGRDGIARA